MLELAYNILFGFAFVVLGLCVLALIIRSILRKGIPRRVVCINAIGTIVTSVIALLAAFLDEGWLLDVCIVYVLVSCLSVVILSKVYMGKNEDKHQDQ